MSALEIMSLVHTFGMLFLAVFGWAILSRMRRLEHALWNEQLIREGNGLRQPPMMRSERGGAAEDTGVREEEWLPENLTPRERARLEDHLARQKADLFGSVPPAKHFDIKA